MNTIGVLLLAAATAGDGFGYSKPGVGLKKLLRPHVVTHGAPPAGGMISPEMGPGGPGGPGGPPGGGRRFANVKSQIYFLDPDGMHVGWQAAGAGGGERVYLPAQLTVPARYNFLQGYIYRLKLTEIPGRPGASLYPTLEVAPSTPATDAYLTHNPIPVQFTAEDFDQVLDGGNFVTKVIYLPDPRYQELAIAGVETLVSTRLEPGVDPVLEADKRGTILLIVRVGAIDLEMQGNAPMMAAPAASTVPMTTVPGPTVLPPATLPPGAVTAPPAVPAPSVPPAVPVDTAPVTPVPPSPEPNLAPTPPPPSPTTPPAPAEPAPAPPAEEPKPDAPAPAVEGPAPAVEAPTPAEPAPADAPKL